MTLPEWIGIDEVYSRPLSYKNAAYLCVLVDGEKRCLYDILGSRSKTYLSNHFSAISKEERDKVKYVTIDMYEVYKDIAKQYFPNCIVAVDPFHYVRHLCDDFNHLRINLMKKCQYGSSAHFNTKLNRRDIFNLIVDNFPVLYDAYLLKEEFRDMVKNDNYDNAKAKYDDLYLRFKESSIKEYDEFIKILSNWKEEILNSFLKPYQDYKLSNAFTENINGHIKTYIDVSNGILNFKRFRKRVLYSLNPKVYYSISRQLKSDKYKRPKRGPYKKIKE